MNSDIFPIHSLAPKRNETACLHHITRIHTHTHTHISHLAVHPPDWFAMIMMDGLGDTVVFLPYTPPRRSTLWQYCL